MTLPVAILAGGLATRLRPLTEKIPKSLVEIAGRPFICHQLAWLRREGIESAVLCVGYLGEQIVEVVGDGAAFGIDVRYSFDGERLAGTGGALRRALPSLGEAFFVLYGDSYLRCPFADVEAAYAAAGRPALMTVLRNDGSWDTSNAAFEDGLVRYDKRNPGADMRYIDYGLSVVRASIFDPYPRDEAFDVADVYAALSRAGELAGYEVRERFYEIGSSAGLVDTERFLSGQNVK